jgi:hypothetical protein
MNQAKSEWMIKARLRIAGAFARESKVIHIFSTGLAFF